MSVKTSHAPLYVQIADQLKSRVGELGPGARIPSEPQLAREFSVSRFTITRAVEQLVDEGLVTRRQGSGSFVAEAPLRRAPGYLLSFTEAVSAAGHKASHRLLAFGPVASETDLPIRTAPRWCFSTACVWSTEGRSHATGPCFRRISLTGSA